MEDLSDNLLGYIHEHAMTYYDPNTPLDPAKRSSYIWGKKGKYPGNGARTDTGSVSASTNYVDETRLAQLRAINSTQFDLLRLIELCEELNTCYSNGSYFAVIMLTRALLDHVPPIFGVSTFSEVANNYKASRSFKDSMQHLDNSCRKIADAHLHVQIRSKEVLPNRTQVNFANDLDVLLAEIVRILP